jgi:hypothetical protein
LFDIFAKSSRKKLDEERKRNELRPVKIIEERPNVWRIVYADGKNGND